MIGLPNPNNPVTDLKLKSVLATAVTRKIVKPSISKVTIPITYECNQRCKTCGIWSSYLKNPELKSKEMSPTEFEQFCATNDFVWVAFTGGEPFLRPDMGEILAIANSFCKVVSITTNGFSPSTISKAVTEALSVSGSYVLAINISMNGSKEIHDSIAGVPGSFDSARMTLQELRRIADPRLTVGVSYTSSAYNKWEFNTYLREMADIGIGLDNITFGMGQDSPSYYQGKRGSGTVSPGQEYIKEFSETILKGLKIGYNPLKWVSKKYLEGFTKGYQNGQSPRCVAGQYSLMLDPFWNVYPCMFYCPNKPFGNLREVNFDIEKLDLKSCRAIVETCPGCWTPCESYSTIIFRPWRCL